MSVLPDASGTGDAALGRRIRQLRVARGLSARAVAARAEVSPAYLSRLENGRVSPTIATLTRVMQSMDESVANLFEAGGSGPLVRESDRREVRHRGVLDRLVTPATAARLEVLETFVEPGASSGAKAYDHPGDEECLLLLDGQLTVWLDDEEFHLTPGDALTYPCRTPHRWENPGDTTARALWIVTPARY